MSFDEEELDPHGECKAEIDRLVDVVGRQQSEIEGLRAALTDAANALYNGFEPDNQSRAYKKAMAAINQQPKPAE